MFFLTCSFSFSFSTRKTLDISSVFVVLHLYFNCFDPSTSVDAKQKTNNILVKSSAEETSAKSHFLAVDSP